MSCRIGIVGCGRFGKMMARYLADRWPVQVHDPFVPATEIVDTGAEAAGLAAAAENEVVVLAVPISRLREALVAIAPHLKAGSLVVDVCSVKELPVRWMAELLPTAVEILGTHPMFGPDSAADSLTGRKIVLCPVRIGRVRYTRIEACLREMGLEVLEAAPVEHDRQIALSLALTHFIGRALGAMGARPQAIDTEGYRRLLRILEVVENDTWQLFEDMHCFNPSAGHARESFWQALREIEGRLNCRGADTGAEGRPEPNV